MRLACLALGPGQSRQARVEPVPLPLIRVPAQHDKMAVALSVHRRELKARHQGSISDPSYSAGMPNYSLNGTVAPLARLATR
jgi:hypothetical protein